jgi:hypothetical protein
MKSGAVVECGAFTALRFCRQTPRRKSLRPFFKASVYLCDSLWGHLLEAPRKRLAEGEGTDIQPPAAGGGDPDRRYFSR